MKYGELHGFIRDLEAGGDLRRIRAPVDPVLEVTEICQRTLCAGGPALLFENPRVRPSHCWEICLARPGAWMNSGVV